MTQPFLRAENSAPFLIDFQLSIKSIFEFLRTVTVGYARLDTQLPPAT